MNVYSLILHDIQKLEDSFMLVIPLALQAQFEEYLRNKAVPNRLHGEYKKWLRYYLDLCGKYHFPPT
jgi:hypothetical protein